jgi:ABC-type polysaccharide/polyol phosphate export permease
MVSIDAGRQMKDRPETSVNSPHVTRELLATWVISIGAMLAGAWLLVTRPFPDDAWIGGLVVNLMGVALGVGLTTLILNAQICVRYRDGKFLISRWLTHCERAPRSRRCLSHQSAK